MSTVLMMVIFFTGYLAIAFEQTLKLNKAASALITGVLCWTVHISQNASTAPAVEELLHHVGEIASILFFLLGAMTIVELVDSHHGFDLITRSISTTSKRTLLLIIAPITFFLSALLDNLTTAIVMTSLCAKLLDEKEDKLWFAAMIIIAANAGGAWSPLGDVTTTMLWIGGQVTAWNIITQLLLPSMVMCLVPVLLIAYRFKGRRLKASGAARASVQVTGESRIILFGGIGCMVFVPVFQAITHLPPFMGMLLALGLMWIITTLLHKDKDRDQAELFNVSTALQKIDAPSILFFLGILLAVSALQSMGLLRMLAAWLTATLKNDYLIGIALGLLSSLVDNVPLVAAAQAMFSLTHYPADHVFWEFLALVTGSGGSIIIIGSAAGVVVMGLEQISFMWYLKKISWLALAGFFSGVVFFMLQHRLMP